MPPVSVVKPPVTGKPHEWPVRGTRFGQASLNFSATRSNSLLKTELVNVARWIGWSVQNPECAQRTQPGKPQSSSLSHGGPCSSCTQRSVGVGVGGVGLDPRHFSPKSPTAASVQRPSSPAHAESSSCICSLSASKTAKPASSSFWRYLSRSLSPAARFDAITFTGDAASPHSWLKKSAASRTPAHRPCLSHSCFSNSSWPTVERGEQQPGLWIRPLGSSICVCVLATCRSQRDGHSTRRRRMGPRSTKTA